MGKVGNSVRDVSNIVFNALLASGHAYCGTHGSSKGKKISTAEAIVKDHFVKSNAARYGWPKLSKEYKAWKDRAYPGKAQNVMTGDLESSIVGHGVPRVRSDGTLHIRWYNVPIYAKRLIAQGRHPTKPDRKDGIRVRLVVRRFIRQALRARKTRSSKTRVMH